MKALDRLVHLFQALQHGIVVRTREERRGIETVLSAVSALDSEREVFTWSAASGLNKIVDYPHDATAVNVQAEIRDAFVFAATQEKPIVLILLDAQNGFEGPAKRYCREALVACRKIGSSLVFIGNDYKLPAEFSSDVWILDLPLPELDEIVEYVKSVAERYQKAGDEIKLEPKCYLPFARACQGLTMGEVQSILSLAVVEYGGITKDCVKIALAEKVQIVKRDGLLEIETPKKGIEDVGGLSILKTWLKQRLGLFSEDARKAGINSPKGFICAGIGGTGKSLIARATAALWDVGLVRLDVGKLFDQYVGNTEANVRRALQTAEAFAPCVLLIDEIDKGLGKANSGGDSGTSNRVLSTIMTWLQDKKSEVFVIGTCNHLSMLDPAMLRAGRFDAVFYVDLPSTQAREEIFKIHLDGKMGQIKQADIPKLAKLAEGYVGSEIEQVVQDARITARSEGTEVTLDIMTRVIKAMVPVSITMKEEIDSMRQLVKAGRVRLADEIEKTNNWLAGDILPPLPKGKGK
jgi:AAA+ superfamily predicted ATPase